jgi:CheY-like chemotaxis protein
MRHDPLPGSGATTDQHGRAGPPPTILVVDDETALRELIHDILAVDAYHVLLARNGQEGLVRALEDLPDLVLTDIMMPLMDGHALCRRLRAARRTAQIPVIGMSAAPLAPDGAPFTATIAKPFDPAALLALIRAQLAEGS